MLLPRERARIVEALDAGVVDVIMSGTRASTRNAAYVALLAQPYAEEAVAFLVEDYRREEFASVAGLRGRRLRIVMPSGVARGGAARPARRGDRAGGVDPGVRREDEAARRDARRPGSGPALELGDPAFAPVATGSGVGDLNSLTPCPATSRSCTAS